MWLSCCRRALRRYDRERALGEELRRPIGACSSRDVVGASHADSCRDAQCDEVCWWPPSSCISCQSQESSASQFFGGGFGFGLGVPVVSAQEAERQRLKLPKLPSDDSNSPYAPRPMFIALWSSLVIMEG